MIEIKNENNNVNSLTVDAMYIHCKDVSIGYKGSKPIIQNVDCLFSQGEFIVLLGRNGQGKSSLLKTFVSILQPLKGVIEYNNRFSPIQKNIAYVPSSLEMYGFLTVEEYIGLGRYNHTNFLGTLTKYDKEIIQDSIQTIGIEQLRLRQFSTLSDGEKQKCHIARALAQEPMLMILDEPTSHLDLPMKRTIINLLHSISQKNIGILLSTHDIHTIVEIPKALWFVENNQSFFHKEGTEYPTLLQNFFDESGIKKA